MTWRKWGSIRFAKAKMFPLFRLISCHSEFLSVYFLYKRILQKQYNIPN